MCQKMKGQSVSIFGRVAAQAGPCWIAEMQVLSSGLPFWEKRSIPALCTVLLSHFCQRLARIIPNLIINQKHRHTPGVALALDTALGTIDHARLGSTWARFATQIGLEQNQCRAAIDTYAAITTSCPAFFTNPKRETRGSGEQTKKSISSMKKHMAVKKKEIAQALENSNNTTT